MCLFFRFQNIPQLFFFSYCTSMVNTAAISMTIVMNIMDVAHLWTNPKKILIGSLKKLATCVSIFHIPIYSITFFFLSDLNLKYSGHFHSHCPKFHRRFTPMEKSQKICKRSLEKICTFCVYFFYSKVFHNYFDFFIGPQS